MANHINGHIGFSPLPNQFNAAASATAATAFVHPNLFADAMHIPLE
jgi:hypothetical protein